MKAELFFEPGMVQLLKVIQRGSSNEANELIARGENLNIRGKEGITPLLWLITQNDNSAVELALKLGADPNYPALVEINRDGPKPAQPLAIIAGENKNDLFRLLLEHGADPNSRDQSTKRPAVFGSIGHDNWAQLEMLLEYGVDLNETDGLNRNPALYAAYLDKYDFVQELIKRGAEPHMPDNGGVTLAYVIADLFESQKKNPAFRISEDTHKTKALLIEKGISFPPLPPKQVKARLAAGESINP